MKDFEKKKYLNFILVIIAIGVTIYFVGNLINPEVNKNHNSPVNLDGFRDTTWGIDMEEVQAIEEREMTLQTSDLSDSLFFRTVAYGEDVLVEYQFQNGKLTKGEYFFENKGSKSAIFETIKKELVLSWGKPQLLEKDKGIKETYLWKLGKTNVMFFLSYDEESMYLVFLDASQYEI